MNRHRLLYLPLALTALATTACTVHTYPVGAVPARHVGVTPANASTPAPVVVSESRVPQAAPKAKTKPRTKPVFLGSRVVDLRAEKDTIHVGNGGRFRAVQLHVSKSPLALYRMRITFGDGSHFVPSTRLHFERNSWTRRIDLPGQRRRIHKVEFWYRSKVAKNGKARIQLVGLR